jgi:hypothetical protein
MAQPWAATWLSIVGLLAFVTAFVRVGADCYWLVALGHEILDSGSIPDGLPFAEAPTSNWPNVVVVAELLFAAAHTLGPVALPGIQLVIDAALLALLALGARRLGASDRTTAFVLLLVAIGALTSLVIVRAQMLSLAPFAALLLILRAEAQQASRRAWLLPPLFALWGNLHGAVLVGVAVAGCYLLLNRLLGRLWETMALGLLSLAALLLTPAGPSTIAYYVGVFNNEAARRGSDMWARLDLSKPFDLLLILSAVLLIALAARRRRQLWEYAALLGLGVGTLMAARHGVWLLLFLAAPAAAGATRTKRDVVDGEAHLRWPFYIATGTSVVLAVVTLSLTRSAEVSPVDRSLVSAVVQTAAGRVVLAPEPLAESLAIEGVRVWASDPIDAFSSEDQIAFLDFLSGGPHAARAIEASELVVAEESSISARRIEATREFVAIHRVGAWVIYVRHSASAG